ncbi:MAG: RNB domain-containing ribonuclease [Thermodesulfobacteriaceae bacterium]|nr:RNB domain-containing ribonuclease [Thermodesulfobacteriaceae bacterium]
MEILKNRLVELLYKEKIITCYVKDIKEKRLHVILPTGKEELISFSATVYCGEKVLNLKDLNQILTLLKEKNERRERLKESFNLEEVWEVLVEEVSEISAKELTELYLGRTPEEDEIAGLLRKSLEERTYFKLKEPGRLEILSKEEVERIFLQRKRELERLAKINEGEEFLKKLLKKEDLSNFSSETQEFWISGLKDYVLWGDVVPSTKLVKEVLKRLNLIEPFKVFEILVKNQIWSEDENLDLLRTKFPTQFSEKALKEVEELLKLEVDFKERIDLTHLQTFTVDAEETEDFDDALSLEETEKEITLYVHIAEVAGFIKPGSALWESALERASTLYLPDRIYPMLPFSLSNEKFSLKKGKKKPAFTFKIVFNPHLEVISFEPMLSFIEVKQRFVYERVDELLKVDPFWQKLYRLLKIQDKKREEKGAVFVSLPEIQVRVNERGEIFLKRIEMTPARELIASAMILTNTLTAEFLYKNNIPAIYRSQPKPLEVIEGREKSLYLKLLQLKYLAKSEISMTPSFHSGLGVEYYTTITSPIRRFLDLFVQYQLKCFLQGTSFLSEEDTLQILAELNNNWQRAVFLQNKREKYFLLKYFQKYLKNEILKALVLEVQNKKAKVYLIDYNLSGEIIGFKDELSPGEEIKVRVEKVQPHQELLRLSLA